MATKISTTQLKASFLKDLIFCFDNLRFCRYTIFRRELTDFLDFADEPHQRLGTYDLIPQLLDCLETVVTIIF